MCWWRAALRAHHPQLFAEHFECLDDYASSAVFAGLIRILKYLAFLLAVFGPGLYVMAVAFAPEIIPIQLLTKLARGRHRRHCRR